MIVVFSLLLYIFRLVNEIFSLHPVHEGESYGVSAVLIDSIIIRNVELELHIYFLRIFVQFMSSW